MTDEPKLIQATSRALKAKQLLENELLAEAFKGLEESYTAFWRATTIDDVAAREKMFLAINIVCKVQDHLRVILDNGKLAQKELQNLAEIAERKKRFGTL